MTEVGVRTATESEAESGAKSEEAAAGQVPAAPHGAEAMRGHHLLCALGFRGHGYSQAFADHMASVLNRLDRTPDTVVVVVDAADAICSAFPSDQTSHCAENHVVARDRRVITALGLHPGDARSWRELRARVGRAFVPADLATLCATCPWLPLGYCQEGLDRLNALTTQTARAARTEHPE